MYKIKVNGKEQVTISHQDNRFSVGGKTIEVDLSSPNDSTIHALYQQKSYTIEVIEKITSKKILLKINSREYLIEIEDQYDELLHKLGLDKMTSASISEIKAPMPGLVLNIMVQEGDEVKKGDNLMILEAMKMENSIKSPIDGTVKNLKVATGDKLEKNQVMITFK
jgi:biotin carboxyl carrier protein